MALRVVVAQFSGQVPTPVPTLVVDHPTDPNGMPPIAGVVDHDVISWRADESTTPGWGAYVKDAEGNILARLVMPMYPGTYRAEEPPCYMQPKALAFPEAKEPLQHLRIEGAHFHDQHGRWYYKGCTDFCLYKHFLDGQDIRPMLRQRVDVGANIVRVLMQMHFITRFYPRDYGDAFYDRTLEFNHIVYTQGLRWQGCCYADEQEIKSGRLHFDRFTGRMSGAPNFLFELGNEMSKNGINPHDYPKPAGMLSSQGSEVGDVPPPMPGWDYRDWHGRRDDPKVRFSAEDGWYVGAGYGTPADGDRNGHAGVHPAAPCVGSEMMGFSAVPEPNRRSNDPELARQLGASGAAFLDGIGYHSDAGKLSLLFNAEEEKLARAFFRALEGAAF